MRPFRFRLETVRRLRDHAEQRARGELAREIATQVALRDDLERQDDAVAAACDGARVSAVLDRPTWAAMIEQRRNARDVAATELARQHDRVQEFRAQLGEVSRDHKAVVRLEEKHRERHLRDVERATEAEVADLTGRRRSWTLGGAA